MCIYFVVIFAKVEHMNILWTSKSNPLRNACLCAPKIVYENVKNSIIKNRQVLGKNLMSINRRKQKQIVTYPFDGIPFSSEKNEQLLQTITLMNF